MGKKSKDDELGTNRDCPKVHVVLTEASLSHNETRISDAKSLHIKF